MALVTARARSLSCWRRRPANFPDLIFYIVVKFLVLKSIVVKSYAKIAAFKSS